MDFKLKPKCLSFNYPSSQTGQGQSQGHQKGQNRFFCHKIFKYRPMDFKLKPKCPSFDPASTRMGQGQGQGHQKGQNRFFAIKSLNIVLWTSN